MLKSQGQKVYVNGVETRNAELIGLAYLDMLSSAGINESEKNRLTEVFLKHLLTKNLRLTPEREKMLSILLSMDQPNPVTFSELVMQQGICRATSYNFIKLSIEAGIIEIASAKYYFNTNLNL
jgi:hypothetical protein